MSKHIAISDEMVVNKIYHIRGQRIMLDRDLAELYGVDVKQLKRQVRRNISRFPDDFMFELTKAEFENWRSQFGTSNFSDKMGLRYNPFAFTEYGVLMLSSVLKSARAIQVNIQIMRVYTKMKQLLLTHKDILAKIEQLEKKLMKQGRKNKKYDEQMQLLFAYLEELLPRKNEPMKKIGYKRKDEE
ncbi:MAG: ORF6N domain-containing protein [Bacteroidetes bacterium]|nr:ORF6N domain-containing protein [Bacteroidota bacterium]